MKYVLGESAARKLREIFASSAGNSRRQTRHGVSVSAEAFPDPYEVQWAQSANDGNGSWIIWLPTEGLVRIGRNSVDPSAGLTAVGGAYPAGWHILTDDMIDRTNGGTLYLHINCSDTPSATFSASDSSSSQSDDIIAVPVCIASVIAATGCRRVRQCINSAIILTSPNAAGGEGGGETSGITGSFDLVTGSEYSIITHKLVNHRKTFTFTNGLLTSVDDKYDQNVFEATPHVTSN